MAREAQANRFHIAIVGNVGSGKSTLAKLIQGRTDCTLYLENPDDYPFLRLFFASPYAWGFANVLNFVMTKFAQQGRIYAENQFAVQEMYAEANHHIWTPALHEIGYLTQAEREEVDRVYNHIAAAPISTPDVVVVMQASVETVTNRIKTRGRDFEDLDPKFVELLGLLDQSLARFAQNAPDHFLFVDTEVVDCTAPCSEREALLDEIVSRIPRESLAAQD